MAFEINKALLENVSSLVAHKKDAKITALFNDAHYADIAEVMNEISFDEALYIIKLLDSETTAEVLMEADDDVRERVLKNLTAKEIAEEIHEASVVLLLVVLAVHIGAALWHHFKLRDSVLKRMWF